MYTALPITHIRLLVRIKADDPTAICPLGSKFGCSVSEAYTLLEAAKELKLEIVGVWYVHTTHFAEFCYQAADVLVLMKFYCLVFCGSFHVGYGSQNPDSYKVAIKSAHEVFNYAVSRLHGQQYKLYSVNSLVWVTILLFLILVEDTQDVKRNLTF